MNKGTVKKGTVKESVLSYLSAHGGEYISGAQLANELGCTRAAVWKAINGLREEGFGIEGTTNRGYALLQSPDTLNDASVRQALTPEAAALFRIECVSVTTSTNDVLKSRAAAGEAEGLVYAAEAQTAGKGRQGRSFYSPKDTGLYFSVLLRPTLAAKDAVLITAAAAVAGAQACEKACPNLREGDLQIKWVNDLYLDSRKVCGILTEGLLSMETGGFDYAVLGIGFNLYTPDGGWPEDITKVAGSLVPEGEREAGLRSRIVAEFLNAFLPIYRKLPEADFIEEYSARQLVLNREIEIVTGEEPYETAIAVGVDRECHLLVRRSGAPEGELTALGSGEVRIRPKKRSGEV